MKKYLIGLILFTSVFLLDSIRAQNANSNQKIRYEYKKYEKFDFEDLVIEGDTGNPGDISLTSRYQRKFKNKLPYRTNFIPEMAKAVERVR